VARRCVSVVIADRHPVFLCGLKSILSSESDFNVVASCCDGRACVEVIRDQSPDLALIDTLLLDGLSRLKLLEAIKSQHLHTRVVFFESLEKATAIARGSYGVIPKEVQPELLLRCLRTVASGQKLSPRAMRDIKPVKGHQPGPRGEPENLLTALTPRERQVMRLVCKGLSNKEVGRHLNISSDTVKVRLHNIYQKLAIQNRTVLETLGACKLTRNAVSNSLPLHGRTLLSSVTRAKPLPGAKSPPAKRKLFPQS